MFAYQIVEVGFYMSLDQNCHKNAVVERQTSACRSLDTFGVEPSATAFMSQNACKHSDVLALVLEVPYSWAHMLWVSAHQLQGLSVLSYSAVTHEMG